MTFLSPAQAEALSELRGRIEGQVLTPADDGYREARSGFNLRFDQHPALIVVPENSADVAEAVRFAATVKLRVSIHATGHGTARPADGALMIATSRLTDVSIDPVAETATVGAGATWAAVLGPAQHHGLAPLVGSSTGIGAVGYTLGGGMGWLARKYGLGSDSARSFDLVTPDGTALRASTTENPEIFWALKGGGVGTLGVVTGMEIDLYPVATVYAGNLLYPIEQAREVIQRWREWVADVDEALTSSVVLMNFPALEMVPEPVRGRSFVIVRGCWSGDLSEGRALIDSWRAWRRPSLDMFADLPFGACDLISNAPVDPLPEMVSTEWFDELHDNAIDVLIQATVPTPGDSPKLLLSEIRQAGGAIREGAQTAANDLGRGGEFLLQLAGIVPFPDAALWLEAHLQRTRQQLSPYVTGAAYLNFLGGEEKQARAVTAYSPQNLERLRRVKSALDPENRFCHGFGLT